MVIMMMMMLMDGWINGWAVDEIEGFVIGRCRQVSLPSLSSFCMDECMKGGRELDGGLA